MDSYFKDLIKKAKLSKKLEINDVKILDKNWTEIVNLQGLKHLYLHRIKNSKLPDELSNLKQLESFAVSGENISEFPSFILQLPKLTSLTVHHTQITNFSTIKNLTNLTSLNLHNTIIKDFSFFKNLVKLSNLDLSNCELEKIPNEVFYLENLEVLKLSGNNITEIPNDIIKLINLCDLNLSYNDLKNIPREIYQLESLTKFPKIGNNPLNTLKFGYFILSETYQDNFWYLIHTIPNLFDIENDLKRNFFLIKDKNNYCFIKMFTNYHEIFSLHRFLKHNEIENELPTFRLLIHVFGKRETQTSFLNKIRKTINKWVESQGIVYTSLQRRNRKENKLNCMRFFHYNPFFKTTEKKNREFVIDFEQLLEYKSLEKNTYFDEVYNREIAVYDLLKYIGAENETIKTKWNGTQHITNFEIKNFKIFSDISCKFSQNVNILIGKNGLGKTSFLQALTLSLLSVSNVDKSKEFEKYISFNTAKSDLTIYWGTEYREVYIFRNEIKHSNFVDSPQKLILSYGVNLNTNEKLPHTDIVEQLINGNLLPYSTKSMFSDFSTDFYDPLIILERLFLEKKGRPNKLIDNIINRIKNTINEYLNLFSEPEKIKLQGNYADYYYEDLNNNKLQTINLSEGYKDFILQITDIVVRIIAARNSIFGNKKTSISDKLFKEVKGIIIIDEFDRHLHPNLQRRFLQQLRNDFQDIQFILSTHNIFSLQSAEGYTALILSTENNKLKIREKPIKSGLSIKSIYNMYFEGDNNFFGYETEKLFVAFYELIVKVKREEATEVELTKFKKITNQLYEKDEEVQIIISRELRQMERQTGKTFEL